MPTKVEQADLLMSLYGRHGEAPLPVVAACSPSDAFDAAFEAARLAVRYMTPVMLLSDGYIANSSEPWALPDVDALPDTSVSFATGPNADGEFLPYLRDPATLARPWAVPGTPGLEHRVGGLEHDDLTGNVSYNPQNHERMTMLREEKLARIAADLPPTVVVGPEDADLLVVGWGSTFGAIRAGVNNANKAGYEVAHVHLRYLSPLPPDLGDVLARYDKVLVPELNRGQLARVLRSEYLVPTFTLDKIQGLPFKAAEISGKIIEILDGEDQA
jgi:2-oxoglutarate ferredoxin oxidoreductase subunit alpha